MSQGITYVGLDAHQETIVAAVLLPRRKKAEVTKLGNNDAAVRRLVRKLKDKAPGRIVACYEAGPTGFSLRRMRNQLSTTTCTRGYLPACWIHHAPWHMSCNTGA